MSKKILWTIIIVAVVAIIGFWMAGKYNSMVTEQENVETSWGQVENQYQRRMDLIPNLVAVVKGYATHEKETLEGVIEARAKATQITVSADDLTEEQLQAFQQAQGELSQALGRLMAVAEAYPDLKANENFKDLQTQLEGTENRIAVARNTFNEQARVYNTLIRQFPNNIVAGVFGFKKKPYFEADAEAKHAPKIEF
ncbi:MAG: LemA family protein [Paludibacteraceae bacterium]|nr:LemA family protein [Paludibacteraceae bacterium]